MTLNQRIEAVREALSFYKSISSYMANMYEDKPGFDFKHTPVHMDGGTRAERAIAAFPEPMTEYDLVIKVIS